MKNYILKTLIGAVVSFPLFAFGADREVVFSPETVTVSEKYLLLIEGHLPNPCSHSPNVKVSSIDLEKNVVTFRMNAFEKPRICIQQLGAPVQAQIDLLILPIPSGKEFSILFEGVEEPLGTFTLPPRFVSSLPLSMLETKVFKGKLVRHDDLRVFLETAMCPKELIANQATENGLIDHEVAIWGYESTLVDDNDTQRVVTPLTITAVIKK